MVIKVAVNGIGTIGKRVAHAIKLQDDMKLVAIADVAATSWLRTVLEPEGPLYKTDLYASTKEGLEAMRNSGMFVNGLLEDLLASKKIDVVVDCTPGGIGAKNKPLYEKYGVKAVYQGGEEASVADVSFVAIANYEKAINAKSVRVVSCNTTSLVRTLHALDKNFGIEEVLAVLVRRATDPWDEKPGPINAVVPEVHIPSHQGPDLQTVLPHINITTMACKVPSTLAHTHFVSGELKKKASLDEIKNALEKTGRIILLKASHGYTATSRIIERYRDLCRPRYDMYEVAIWDESITIKDKRFYWIHAVHSEAIVIPENIDAIRAITGIEKDKFKSIEKTNKSLGIKC